jgi:hypothetical protein
MDEGKVDPYILNNEVERAIKKAKDKAATRDAGRRWSR